MPCVCFFQLIYRKLNGTMQSEYFTEKAVTKYNQDHGILFLQVMLLMLITLIVTKYQRGHLYPNRHHNKGDKQIQKWSCKINKNY